MSAKFEGNWKHMEREQKLLKFKSSIRMSQQATMKREARETRLQKIAEFAAGDSAAANQVNYFQNQ